MSRLNTYCNAVTPNPYCPGCDYCLGSEGGAPVKGYEWVQEVKPGGRDGRKQDGQCTCYGMDFIANRWVFTGRCRCND